MVAAIGAAMCSVSLGGFLMVGPRPTIAALGFVGAGVALLGMVLAVRRDGRDR